VRSRQTRSAVARLVVDLIQAPPTGGLRDAFARIVGDPELVLGYPLDGSGRLVDAFGAPVEPPSGREQTTLVREGKPVAVLSHTPGLLDDEELTDELAATARLALENERLQAEVRARLEELRRSRARIVEAADTERRRLERDLHDGAQQQLVTLSLSLRLLRTRSSLEGDAGVLACLDQAEAELQEAIAELRELAHGLFPAVLADEGFAVAVEALREEARVPIRIHHLPEERCGPAAETAAYIIVAEAARAASNGISVDAQRNADALLVDVEANESGLDLVPLEDRVRALDGELEIRRDAGGRVIIHAELPCAS
jgi:signal transduction histidine kinase